MTPYAANLPRRYPGLKPFDRAQSAVFYGRREDAVRLSNLILQQRLSVLFAKSGIGKTSILQAGVAPSLEQQNYAPLFIRLDKTDAPLVDTVGEILTKSDIVGGRDATGERPGEHETLWERMKRLEFDIDGLPATPVLVFDQFEEVFTLGHSESSRRRFLAELADLANSAMPDVIRTSLLQRFQEGDATMTPEIMRWWESQPELRIVISIRSDFLHLLDEISPLIPGILHNRYQLQPLNRKQAEEAIALPADAAGGPYASARFRYRADALDQIIDFLAGREEQDVQQAVDDLPLLKKQDEIESFNLQILCQYVEEKIIDHIKPEGFEVTPDFYGAQQGLESEIRDFYQKQLQTLPDVYARKTGKRLDNPAVMTASVQRLIEESLVTPNDRRCSMVDDYLIAAYPGVTHEFLDVLVDSRLLRKENRLNDFYYEISHDTLLPAVVESRNKRRRQEKAEQERLEYEQKLAEEAKRREAVEAELTAIRRQRRMARMVAITSLLSLVVMIGFGIWFVRDYINAAKDQLRNAERSVYNELYGAAIPSYEEIIKHPRRCWVLRHSRPSKDVKDELVIAQQFDSLYQLVDSSLARGDRFFFRDNYAAALETYHDAKKLQDDYNAYNWEKSPATDSGRVWRVDSMRVVSKFYTLGFRIENARNSLIKEFKIRQRDYEVFSEAKVWGQALRNLERMEQLLPVQPEDLSILQRQLNLDEAPRDYVRRELERCEREIRR
ncbi:MAG TPA: hypothetical protein PK228_00855, partial [Saprospiraceae bacterium]|nr:hypothetical protein [Saprospiraceae bacterium]